MKREHISLIGIVREVLRDKKQITLSELYNITTNHPDIHIDKDKIKHRIRSTVYTLNKSGELQRIGNSTYRNICYEEDSDS